MKALIEFVGLIAAAFVAFAVGLLMLIGVLMLWFLGLVSALMLLVSAFAGLVWLFTGKSHAGLLALVYLGYAAVPFVIVFVFQVYRIRWTESWRQRHSIATLGRLRMAQDTVFNE